MFLKNSSQHEWRPGHCPEPAAGGTDRRHADEAYVFWTQRRGNLSLNYVFLVRDRMPVKGRTYRITFSTQT